MAAQWWLRAALPWWMALSVAAALAQESCPRDVQVERPLPGAVRVVVTDPCRAGGPVTFRHNGREVVRFADDGGRVELLRILDPDHPDVIELITPTGERRLFAETGAEAERPATAEAAEGKTAVAPAGGAPARPVPSPTPSGPQSGSAEAAEKAVAPQGVAQVNPARRETEVGRAAAGGGIAGRETGAGGTCPVQLEVAERDGLARIAVQGPCPAGMPVVVRVEPRGWTFHRSLDGQGRAELTVPLVDPEVRIAVETDGVTPVIRTLRVSGRERLLRVLLVWEAGTDLDLHVLEPGGRLSGEVRHLHPGNPTGGGQALGRLERFDDGTRLGTKIESYGLERARAEGAVLRLFVADVARGRRPVPPHCSGGELASPVFHILVVDGETVRERTFRIPVVVCGARLDDQQFFLPVGSVQVR